MILKGGVMNKNKRLGDMRNICVEKGCTNLGEVYRRDEKVVYRRRFCTKHKRMFYNNKVLDINIEG